MHEKVLIIEDELSIAELLKYALEKEGMIAKIAENGAYSLFCLQDFKPDVVLLDLMLPDKDGLEICTYITEHYPDTAVIIVSAKNDQSDKLIGLETGADDYITKPFDIREVVLRVKTIFRRLSPKQEVSAPSVIQDCGVVIDIVCHSVTYNGDEISLTPKEFSLLVMFFTNKGMVFRRRDILQKIWGYEYYGDSRTVDIHIQRIRKKFKNEDIIQTVFGIGYRYNGI